MIAFRKLFPAIPIAIVLAASFAATAQAQTPDPASRPSFEVASVKQNKLGGPQRSNVPLDTGNVYAAIDPLDKRTAAGGYFVAINQPLWQFITFAYKLSGTQELALRFSYFDGLKSKAPAWVTGGFESSAERFNIEARAPANSTLDDMRLMMQSLLAERFQLAVHREGHDAPAFALVLIRPGATGPHLRPHSTSDVCTNSLPQQDKPADPVTPFLSVTPAAASAVGNLPPACGVIAHVVSAEDPRSSFGGRGVPISLLASSLPTMTGMATISRPVVDQTGLAGLYDLNLHWRPSTDPDTGDNAANFRDALKTQLGLGLKPTRAAIEILVIDKVEQPSED